MPKHTLLQITDTHLSADADAQMQGINTSASLAKVISHARAQGVDFDAVLATGDISQDGSAESYARFLELTSALQPTPLLWLPGNHDSVASMAAARTESPSSLQLGSWLVLMLDSTVAGSPHGELGQQRLEDLRARLADVEAAAGNRSRDSCSTPQSAAQWRELDGRDRPARWRRTPKPAERHG
jgi:Icc protein